jgi:hypothetical protein
MNVYAVLLMAAICALIYWLYRRGILVTKSIWAILFVFRTKQDKTTVSMNACTGWLCHARRFPEDRIYEFHFDNQLSSGVAEVALLDSQKQELLCLSRSSVTGKIALRKGDRFYLRWEFQNATGRCELSW